MTESLSAERERLQALLARYEAGEPMRKHGEPGILPHANVAERCARVKARIAEIDRRLSPPE
jgi:hypothetical protein